MRKSSPRGQAVEVECWAQKGVIVETFLDGGETGARVFSNRRGVFEPTRIGALELRNRIIKTATFEGMSPGGYPSARLARFHEEVAQGGAALSTLALCAVHESGRSFPQQIVMDASRAEELGPTVDAVHRAGGALSVQLCHCGSFTKDRLQRTSEPPGPIGPSAGLNRLGLFNGLSRVRAMTKHEIFVVVRQFEEAALQAKSAGFDAIELHMGHGYLLSQFLSPALNHRTDDFGGSLENRIKVPLLVIQAVRKAVGKGFPILCQINLRDHISGGLEVDEAVRIARIFESQEGGVDALLMSGGLVSHSASYLLRGERPLAEIIHVEPSFAQRTALRMFGRTLLEDIPFSEMFFWEQALEMRKAVSLPLVLLGGVVSRENLDQAMVAGFDFVGMGRALLENPRLVLDLKEGKVDRSGCTHCNRCVAEMARDGIRCVLREDPPASR